MAWRFKASKYKNAAPISPKFEQIIRDLSIGSYRSHGNFIAASAAFMAFNWDVQGSNLAVLPINAQGRQNKSSVPLIYAHSDMVTDFQFSPFDDGLLASGSQDSTIKLWRIPASGMPLSGLTKAELVLPEQPRRVETINFHPTADGILASSSATALNVWDLQAAKEVFCFPDHGDEVQSVDWQPSGQCLATQCKDMKLRILDPRQQQSLAMECDSHQAVKDSKVVYVAENRVLTTGFSADRLREITIRDLRNINSPQKNLTLDMSSGILVPLFDLDTNMCFLCGKGDRNIQFIEVTNSDPFIVEGLKYAGDQTKGACLVPKRAMNVMSGEVNRVLQLSDSSIVPIMWQVPRKSYREYHADIYPETHGVEPALGPENWIKGENAVVPKINLDPTKRPSENLAVIKDLALADRPRLIEAKTPASSNGSHVTNGSNGNHRKEEEKVFAKPCPKPRCSVSRSSSSSSTSSEVSRIKPVPMADSPMPKPRVAASSASASASIESSEAVDSFRRQPSIRDRKKQLEEQIKKSQEANGTATNGKAKLASRTSSTDEENKENKVIKSAVEMRKKTLFSSSSTDASADRTSAKTASVAKRPVSKVFGRISKFKHLKGDILLKGKFENLKELSKTCPAECNFIYANPERIAVPLTGPGGKLAVFETRKAGRIPDGVTPVLINSTAVMDFRFDPFDNARLVAACDDGFLRVWRIPDGGLVQQMNKPESEFSLHADKIQIVQFNPVAKDVVITAAFDKTVFIWDLNDMTSPKLELQGHDDQLYSLAFSRSGRFVATVCRDGRIRIFDPTSGSTVPVVEGGDIVAKKGARVVWVLNDEYLVVTGFSRQSERQVMLFRAEDMKLLATEVLDVSPAILIPHYDDDSSTLFLTGKGESTVTTFEVSLDPPHFFALSPYKPAGLHQGFAFLPKNVCDVRKVEFARAYRLTNKTIEPVSFTVPRVKKNFFQDDLFPPTRILWEPTMTSSEWFSGCHRSVPRLSLKPEDMAELTSSTPSSTSTTAKAKSRPTSVTSQVIEELPEARNSLTKELAKQKEKDIKASVSNFVDVSDKLEQDQMEGVDESEWAD